MPTTGQFALLILSILLFAAGGFFSVLRTYHDSALARLVPRQCLYWGLVAAIAVEIWHSVQRGRWLPLDDNFDSLIWLAILLAMIVLYNFKTKPIAGIEFFLMPVVVLLLIGATVIGHSKPHPYVPAVWAWVHRASAFAGTIAFFVAGAGGGLYLINNSRLRNKKPPIGPNLSSLERLENLTRTAAGFGFALFTVGFVTGVIDIIHKGGNSRLGTYWFASPKVLMAVGAWVMYALILHAPINPTFRGKKTAILSIIGFVLVIGTIVAIQYMPAGGKH